MKKKSSSDSDEKSEKRSNTRTKGDNYPKVPLLRTGVHDTFIPHHCFDSCLFGFDSSCSRGCYAGQLLNASEHWQRQCLVAMQTLGAGAHGVLAIYDRETSLVPRKCVDMGYSKESLRTGFLHQLHSFCSPSPVDFPLIFLPCLSLCRSSSVDGCECIRTEYVAEE